MTDHSTTSFLDHLNPAQRRAASATQGPVMIIAGAGSGKTRVLTYRIAHLIHQGVPPDSILALTFTNKAASEMKHRISALLGEAGTRVWAGTFHSVFARIFRRECHHLGYDPAFSIYDADESVALVRGIMGSLNISAQEFHPRSIHAGISYAKNHMLTPRAYEGMADTLIAQKTAVVYDRYEKQMKRNNALDFDDLLVKPLALFSRRGDVLERYQYRFRQILVDEYQDTNRVQYNLLRLLASTHGNICVVGDDAQSIYSFRGADIRNILEFEKEYTACQVFRLEQNYRSSGAILAAANSLIQKNQGQIPKTLWTENARGESVVVSRTTDDREEAYRIVALIGDESRRSKRGLRDFVVLYRTNAQSRALEDALRRNGIPYGIVGSVAFYKRKEIKDILAYLSLVANPSDDRSVLRVVNLPSRGVGQTSLEKLSAFAEKEGLSLLQAIESEGITASLTQRARSGLLSFAAMIRKYRGMRGSMTLSELARSLVDETGILVALKEENTAESLGRRENIQELVSALSEFTNLHPDARLEDFLEEVSLVSDVDLADLERNAVTLMTLHSAKGLEYPVVFIAGLEEGIFPLAAAMDEANGIEEERRLMYVGLTRAREKLYLCHAASRYRFGQLSYMVRSRFLDEIDPEFLLSDSPLPTVDLRHSPASARRRQVSREPTAERGSPFPAYEEESQESVHPHVGVRVFHESFGKGRIIALDGDGEKARAIVDFEKAGKKHLLLKYAQLKIENI